MLKKAIHFESRKIKSTIRTHSGLLEQSRKQVVRQVNQTMVHTYFEIGRMIVEEEQQGKIRADYGDELIDFLSAKLTNRFGRGYSSVNLRQMRSFFLNYSIQQTLSAKTDYQSDQAEIQQTVRRKTLIPATIPAIAFQQSKNLPIPPTQSPFTPNPLPTHPVPY